MTQPYYFICVTAVIAGAWTGSAFAQETNNAADGDDDSLLRATRIMRRIDKDGNGTLEKSENAAAWKRYRSLDANRDEVISIDELRRERVAILETDEIGRAHV